VISCKQMQTLQQVCAQLTVDEQLLEYAVRICQATRQHPGLQSGAGPRASIALIRCAKARAMLNGNQFVLPDDVKAMAVPVLRHRLRLSPDMELDGSTMDHVIQQMLDTVAAPHQ